MLRSHRAFVIAAIAALSLALLPAPRAEAQSGFYYLVGLNPNGDNFLALRSEPSAEYGERIARLGPETLLASRGEWAGPWMAVEVINTRNAGLTGWVFRQYVSCCSGSPGRGASGYGRVVHPAGAALNLRRGPSLDAPVIGAIASGTDGIPVSECIYESNVRSWCQVVWHGRNGWVSTRYFELD